MTNRTINFISCVSYTDITRFSHAYRWCIQGTSQARTEGFKSNNYSAKRVHIHSHHIKKLTFSLSTKYGTSINSLLGLNHKKKSRTSTTIHQAISGTDTENKLPLEQVFLKIIHYLTKKTSQVIKTTYSLVVYKIWPKTQKQ
jgi:hypothetical protein